MATAKKSAGSQRARSRKNAAGAGNTTTDHRTIQRWVEERGGCPARVKRTGRKGDPGILRIDYTGFSGKQSLEKISWDEFFEWFDKNKLAFLYQDRKKSGEPSTFSKFVSRDGSRARRRPAGRAAAKQGGAAKKRTASGRRAARKTAAAGKTSRKTGGASSKTKKATSGRRSAQRSTSARSAAAKKSTSTAHKSTARTHRSTTARKATAGKSRSAASAKRTGAASSRARTRGAGDGAGKSSASSNVTTDHDTIRRWVEERGGCPAHVKRSSADGDPGVLRIDYTGFSGKDSLEKISWDRFFEWFDKNDLAFLYQERKKSGEPSTFSKFISRESV